MTKGDPTKMKVAVKIQADCGDLSDDLAVVVIRRK